MLRSDNGGEFVNHDFQTYFQQHGIIHETTCPQTLQQNGVAERKNRHLLETARALLIGAHVPPINGMMLLSPQQNRGKPPNRYSPDIGKTSKYLTANHVSTEKLSELLKAFVHQLSAIHIPTKVSETLKDPKWVQAIKEEMKALKKNQN
ncbi:hypothetical protein L3X38_043619 [Prunus dulcis]|uniref:Integrase catalytic domain-containing protein n=1 Tax=Prunus dulcis TaxID=3755 RepID=A0AAD4UY47_PRUDU|nr:hypothetical protein L3X38_043619 [Prunus dulcis]